MEKINGFLVKDRDDNIFVIQSEVAKRNLRTVRNIVSVFESCEDLELMENLEIRIAEFDEGSEHSFVLCSLDEAQEFLEILTKEGIV